MAPTQIGRYEVVRELGRGGMAMVILARDPYMKRQVAIKVLPRQFTFDPQFRTRFQHEAEVIAALEHPFIVPVHDYGEYDEQPYIVMRYMPGGTLAERLEQGALPLEQVAQMVERIGSAADYAHTQGVIHRDLKPGNILFDGQGNAFLSDFGIAKIAESTSAFTGTAILGTPEYMSPEQAQGNRALDGRTDIYSLGVVLYQALSGKLPFAADTPMGIAVAHIQQPVPDILSVNPSLPQPLRQILQKALAKNPEDRYQTGAELARAVSRLEGTGEGATLHEDVPSTKLEMPPVPPVVPPYPPASEPPPVYPPTPANRQEWGPQVYPPPAYPPQPAPRRSRALIWVLGGLAAVLLCAGLGLTGAIGALRGFGRIATPTATVEVASSLPTDQPTLPAATLPVPITAPIGMSNAAIEYVLDGSGSMNDVLEGGKTKLAIAQNVLSSRVATLPNGMQAGLRVFGTTIPYQNNEANSCKDIEVVVPIAPDGPAKIVQWLPGFQAMGMTPIAESLRQAADDFTFDANHKNFVVLISDGEESCGGDPVAQVRNLQELGIDFTIHVIGMSVDPTTQAQLSAIAQAARGIYHDARTEQELVVALDDIQRAVVVAANVTQASVPVPPTSVPAPANTAAPAFPVDVSKEGMVSASSIYSQDYPARLVLDGDPSTSWFSAGPDADGSSALAWSGDQDEFITSITLVSNEQNQVVEYRNNFGFEAVKIEVIDSAGDTVFSQDVALTGTPDPNVTVSPNVTGQMVLMIFSGSEAPDCGGFAELQILASR